MIDQRVSEGKRFSFFEHMALTTTLPAQLATKYQLDIVPIYIARSNQDNFKMEIYEPIKSLGDESSEVNKLNLTIRLNKIIEKMISKDAGQWIWTHNRWK
jgi:KDO2-lipid IV(A) lauroyltransferase